MARPSGKCDGHTPALGKFPQAALSNCEHVTGGAVLTGGTEAQRSPGGKLTETLSRQLEPPASSLNGQISKNFKGMAG